MRTIVLASVLAIALVAPALAQENDTLKHVIANGTVVKAKPQGEERTLKWTYKPDGVFSVLLDGQKITGRYWITRSAIVNASQFHIA